MVVDVHTHICPPEIRTDRTRFFAGENDFRLLYENPDARLIGAEELVRHLDEVGVDTACSFGFPWRNDDHTRLCNDYALDSARRHRGRIVAFACVNPLRGRHALREAERCLAEGAGGLGEIATYGAGLGPEVQEGLGPLAKLCEEAGVPLMLHTNEPVGHHYPGKSRMGMDDLYRLIESHHETRWILAHWGAGLFFYHLLRKDVDRVLENVYYDTAAGPFLYKPRVYRQFAEIAGLGKLLFGSDYPLLGLPRYRRDMESAGLTKEEIAAVTGGNSARLLDLGGRQ